MKELCARDVMTRDVTTVSETTPVAELIQLFRVSHFRGVPVVDDEGRAVGVVSDTDVLRALAYTIQPPGTEEFAPGFQAGKGGVSSRLLDEVGPDIRAMSVMQNLLRLSARDLMSPVVHTCTETDSLALVCETMAWKEIHRLVVVDGDGRVIGLVTSLDAVRRFGEELRRAGGGGA